MEKEIKLSWEQVKPLVPKAHIYYVDQNDDLSHKLDEIESAIHKSSYEDIDDITFDWDVDILDEKEEVKSAIERDFPELSEEDIDEIMDELNDRITDEIYDNDTSTPIKDLFRNTGKQTMFYDTGYEMDSESWNWSKKRIIQERKCIKNFIGLKKASPETDAAIDMMIMQASYGGNLVIYFYDDLEKYIIIDEKINSLRFSNFALAIINTSNGSGDHCYCTGTVILPLEKERIHICKNIKYSYTHSVCQMSSNWCENTKVEFSRTKCKRILPESSLSEITNRDKRFDIIYKAGKCSAGDMDITRHRNTTYINNYPCGNRCQDCGTFWID
jgi:hypothetical protein